MQEYWAEGAQCWFDCANPRNSGGASNRDELKAKDEPLAALLTEVYGDPLLVPWEGDGGSPHPTSNPEPRLPTPR